MSVKESVTQTTALNRENRYAHVDAMRAFSVIVVVVSHSGLGHLVPGGSGVTVFFAISGFVITTIMMRERDRTDSFRATHFYAKRALKLFPPFLLVVIIPTLFFALFSEVDWTGFWSQVFFSFNWYQLSNGSDGVLPGSSVVWSLAIEEQFYIVFAIVWIFIARSKRWSPLLLITAVASIALPSTLRFLLAIDSTNADRIYFGTDTRIDGIGWGILAAVLINRASNGSPLAAGILRRIGSDTGLAISVGVFVVSIVVRDDWFRDTLRYSFQSIAAGGVLVYGFGSGKSLARRAFIRVTSLRCVQVTGLASYSIYLVHLEVNLVLNPTLSRLPALVTTAILTTAGVALGTLIWRMIEVPTERFKQRRFSSPPSRRQLR